MMEYGEINFIVYIILTQIKSDKHSYYVFCIVELVLRIPST